MHSQTPMTTPPGLAVYVHWPFCLSQCPYCDFNRHVRDRIDITSWRDAYIKTLHHMAPLLAQHRVTSVFFGGGTPSLMPVWLVEEIIHTIRTLSHSSSDASWDTVEVTLEANPSSSEAAHFKGLAGAGVNRISLGIQSLNPQELTFLGRRHNADEARRAMELAAESVTRYSFDWIYGLPMQTEEAWLASLQQVLTTYTPSHLSCYMLTIEKGTPFYTAHRAGAFVMPTEEVARALFDGTHQLLEQAGLPAYEPSNFAKPGEESRHNLTYWRYQSYLGIGPGAHSRLHGVPVELLAELLGEGAGAPVSASSTVIPVPELDQTDSPLRRGCAAHTDSREHSRVSLNGSVLWDCGKGISHAWMMHHQPEAWLHSVQQYGHGLQQHSILTPEEAFQEAVMMGLRLTEGLSLFEQATRFGVELDRVLDLSTLQLYLQEGWLQCHHAPTMHVSTTAQGRPLLNHLCGNLLTFSNTFPA